MWSMQCKASTKPIGCPVCWACLSEGRVDIFFQSLVELKYCMKCFISQSAKAHNVPSCPFSRCASAWTSYVNASWTRASCAWSATTASASVRWRLSCPGETWGPHSDHVTPYLGHNTWLDRTPFIIITGKAFIPRQFKFSCVYKTCIYMLI